jgi:hypothetical protein
MDLPTTLIFDYATPDALTTYLSSRLAARSAQGLSRADAAEHKGPSTSLGYINEVASQEALGRPSYLPADMHTAPLRLVVRGRLVTRLPVGPVLQRAQEPRSVSALHVPVAGFGVDATRRVPPSRYDVQCMAVQSLFGVGTVPAQFGGFLPCTDIAHFDAAAFGIAAPEAALIDPQQRLLLEAGAQVLSGCTTAGGGRKGLSRKEMGAYVGVSSSDYNKISLQHTASGNQPMTAFSSTGASLSVAAGRLAYAFDLRGNAVTVDTACSSSLVAAHSAATAMHAMQCRSALVGGANVTLTPDTPAAFTKAGDQRLDLA